MYNWSMTCSTPGIGISRLKSLRNLLKLPNFLVPIMPIGEKTAPFKVYNEKLTYPEDPIAPEWYGGANDRVRLRTDQAWSDLFPRLTKIA